MHDIVTTKGRTKKGTVISNKMKDTVIVIVNRRKLNRKYHKRYLVTKKYYADTNGKNYAVGEAVVLKESRPLSKLKRWVVIESLGDSGYGKADYIEDEAVKEALGRVDGEEGIKEAVEGEGEVRPEKKELAAKAKANEKSMAKGTGADKDSKAKDTKNNVKE